MSGRVIDPHGFEKHFRTDADGTTIMYQTKGGMQQMTTERHATGSSNVIAPNGLVSYPFAGSSAWVLPQVIRWDGIAGALVSKCSDPVQTKQLAPNPPAFAPIQVGYSVNSAGCVSVAAGSGLFYGEQLAEAGYSKWSKMSYQGDGTPLFPFQVTPGMDKFVVCQSTGKTSVNAISGSPVSVFSPVRIIDGEEKPTTQLAPSVNRSGTTVCLNACNDTNWGVPGPGFYEAIPEKRYYMRRIAMSPGEAASTIDAEADLHCYSQFDGSWSVTGGAYDPDASMGSCDALWIGWVPGTNGTGNWAAPFGCPVFWVPSHYKSYSENAAWEQSSKLKQNHERRYLLPLDATTVVGYVAVGEAIEPVTIRVTGNLDQRIYAEGQGARGDVVVPTTGGINGWAGTGDSAAIEKRIVMTTSNVDAFEVKALVSTMNLTLFSHKSTSHGEGRLGYKDRVGLWSGIGSGALRAEMVTGYPDSQRDSGGADEGRAWTQYYNDDGSNANFLGCDGRLYWGIPHMMHNGREYVGMDINEIKGEVGSWETYVDKFNLLGEQNDGTWRRTNEVDTPYAGTVDFDATSRVVIAFDAALDFVAYVEINARAVLGYSSGAGTWVIASRLSATHTVSAKVVVEYAGTKYAKDLFSVEFDKPGPWHRQVIIDWRTWPWTSPSLVPDTVYTVQGPRIWPDVNKYGSVDSLFMHQGVNPDLAGIPAAEYGAGNIIFAKRFKFTDINANQIFDDYAISEGKRTTNPDEIAVPYYYCPELKQKVTEDDYQIQFNVHDGAPEIRVWTNDIPPASPGVAKGATDMQASICYRV